MPTIRLTTDTMRLIRSQALPGFDFLSTARRRLDGDWDVPVDDDVAYRIALKRMPGETDDDVVSRPVRAAIGQQPD